MLSKPNPISLILNLNPLKLKPFPHSPLQGSKSMSPPLLLRSSTETPHPSSPPSKPTRHFDPTALRNSFDRLLQSLTSHPFVQPLISIHSQYQSFIQVHLRVPRVSAHRNVLSSCNFAAILPGDSVAGLVVANGVNSFLNLYNTLLVVRLVLTWFPNSPPAIVSPLSTICDPYLNIFRGIIPPLGGTLDLSPHSGIPGPQCPHQQCYCPSCRTPTTSTSISTMHYFAPTA